MAHLTEVSLLSQLVKPPILIFGCGARLGFHFYVQAMVPTAGNRQMKIGNTLFHTLALEVCGFPDITVTAIGNMVKKLQTRILLSY